METLNDTDLEPSTTSEESDVDVVVERGATAKKPPEPGPGAAEHSYEEGWYQVLKRRADESDDED